MSRTLNRETLLIYISRHRFNPAEARHRLVPYTQRMSPLPYEFPALPSPQVKVIQEYLKFYSEFHFEGLSKVTTDDFTQQTWPMNLDQPIRAKAEEIAALKQLRDALGGTPMQVSKAQYDHKFGQITNLSDSLPYTISTTVWGRLGSMYSFFYC